MWIDRRSGNGIRRAARPSAQFRHRSPTRQRYSYWRRLGRRVPACPRLVTSTTSSKDTATTAFWAAHRRPSECDNPSGWGPRELLDAPENLPKENWRQVALGQLPARRSGVPSLPPDESPSGDSGTSVAPKRLQVPKTSTRDIRSS